MVDHPASTGVLIWWTLLSLIAAANIVAWFVTAARVRRGGFAGSDDEEIAAARRTQLALAAVFVFVCAYRSFLPRAEGQRICMIDTWISSAALARSGATVAELALVAQWALALRALGQRHGVRVVRALWWVPLLLISFAEVCSWYTTLTTNFAGSVVEESTWGVTGTLLVLGLLLVHGRTSGSVRRFVQVSIAAIGTYVVFMWTVDVPMYLRRWRGDTAGGKTYYSIADGWRDSNQRRVVTRQWDDWKDEVPWMTLYFSAGAWISLALVRTPYLPARREPSAT